MKARSLLPILAVLLLAMPMATWAQGACSFTLTGNVDLDFFTNGVPNPGVQQQADNIGDDKGPGGCLDEPLGANAYEPPPPPLAQIPASGFNLERVVWCYDCATDTLSVGLDVCDERFSWDADCNGNICTIPTSTPNCTGGTLRSLFTDSVLEEYAMDIDVNRDGCPEVTVAVRSDVGGPGATAVITYYPDTNSAGCALPRLANISVVLGPVPANCNAQIPDVELKIIGLATAWPNNSPVRMSTRSGATGDLVNEDITLQDIPIVCPCIDVGKEVACDPAGPFGPTATALRGATVYFKVTVTNCGNEDLKDVVITDVLSSPNNACLGGIPPQINVGNLAAGQSQTFTFPVQTNPAFSIKGTPIDCTNEVSVVGTGVTSGVVVHDDKNTQVGPPDAPEVATVNVLVPEITCGKFIDDDPHFVEPSDPTPPTSTYSQSTGGPVDLYYTLCVENTGEVPVQFANNPPGGCANNFTDSFLETANPLFPDLPINIDALFDMAIPGPNDFVNPGQKYCVTTPKVTFDPARICPEQQEWSDTFFACGFATGDGICLPEGGGEGVTTERCAAIVRICKPRIPRQADPSCSQGLDREFLGYKGLGNDVITSAPGILAIDPGTPMWSNFIGAANPNSPGGLWPGTWRVQNVILKKETPDVFKCSDLFPQRVVQQQGTPNIRLWWPLMYEIPGTKWTLTIQYATSPIPDPNNPGKFLQYDDDGPGPRGPSPVHQEVWEWTVDADLQDLKNLLELFHELPFGKDEVPLISREDAYPVLQQKLSDVIALLNQDPPNTIEAANLILDFELEVADLCIQTSPLRPWPNSGDTGIANTDENPACCKLIVDADYIATKLGLIFPKK